MTTAILTSKGQIVIPSGLRSKYHLEKGTALMVEEVPGGIVLRKADPEHFNRLAGILGKGRNLSKKLLAERRKDKKSE
ncbi:MAG: AbrB/MazE/SpoVT family DNA-binding domain-containing protein [Fibrobacterota bacterium]